MQRETLAVTIASNYSRTKTAATSAAASATNPKRSEFLAERDVGGPREGQNKVVVDVPFSRSGGIGSPTGCLLARKTDEVLVCSRNGEAAHSSVGGKMDVYVLVGLGGELGRLPHPVASGTVPGLWSVARPSDFVDACGIPGVARACAVLLSSGNGGGDARRVERGLEGGKLGQVAGARVSPGGGHDANDRCHSSFRAVSPT